VTLTVHNATGKSLGAYVKTTPFGEYEYRTPKGHVGRVSTRVTSLVLR
jgi:hypothetical protein